MAAVLKPPYRVYHLATTTNKQQYIRASADIKIGTLKRACVRCVNATTECLQLPQLTAVNVDNFQS